MAKSNAISDLQGVDFAVGGIIVGVYDGLEDDKPQLYCGGYPPPTFFVGSQFCSLRLPRQANIFDNGLHGRVGLVFVGKAKDGVAVEGDGRKSYGAFSFLDFR